MPYKSPVQTLLGGHGRGQHLQTYWTGQLWLQILDKENKINQFLLKHHQLPWVRCWFACYLWWLLEEFCEARTETSPSSFLTAQSFWIVHLKLFIHYSSCISYVFLVFYVYIFQQVWFGESHRSAPSSDQVIVQWDYSWLENWSVEALYY